MNSRVEYLIYQEMEEKGRENSRNGFRILLIGILEAYPVFILLHNIKVLSHESSLARSVLKVHVTLLNSEKNLSKNSSKYLPMLHKPMKQKNIIWTNQWKTTDLY